MDFFKTLKDLVVEEGSGPANKPAPVVPPSKASTPITSAPSIFSGLSSGVTVSHVAASPDPEIVRRLEARLQTGMPQVYVQFLQQYETLREVIPDETTLFRAALKSSHCSLEQLTQALDQLLSMLATAEEEFNKSLEVNRSSSLQVIQKNVAAVQKGIADHNAQIQVLQQEVTKLTEQGRFLDTSLRDEEQRFDTLHLGFLASLDEVRKKLESQKAHLTQQKA